MRRSAARARPLRGTSRAAGGGHRREGVTALGAVATGTGFVQAGGWRGPLAGQSEAGSALWRGLAEAARARTGRSKPRERPVRADPEVHDAGPLGQGRHLGSTIRLLTRRDELQQRLDAIRADYRRGLPADFAEQAAELENAEVLAAISRAAAEELDGVHAELRRRGLI